MLTNIRPHKVSFLFVSSMWAIVYYRLFLCFTVGGWDFGSDKLVNTRFDKNENLSCLLSNIRDWSQVPNKHL